MHPLLKNIFSKILWKGCSTNWHSWFLARVGRYGNFQKQYGTEKNTSVISKYLLYKQAERHTQISQILLLQFVQYLNSITKIWFDVKKYISTKDNKFVPPLLPDVV